MYIKDSILCWHYEVVRLNRVLAVFSLINAVELRVTWLMFPHGMSDVAQVCYPCESRDRKEYCFFQNKKV